MIAERDGRERRRHQEDHYADSPIHRMLALQLSVPEDGRAVVTLRGNEQTGNRAGHVAGGVLTLLIDSAVVQACRSRVSESSRLSTVEAKVNFLRPAATDDTMTAEGTVDFVGRSIAVGSGRVTNSSGDLIAIGLVTVRIHRSQPDRVG